MNLWLLLTRPVGIVGILALAALLAALSGADGADWLRLSYGLIALESALLLMPARSPLRRWNTLLVPRTSRGFRVAIRGILAGLILFEYGMLWMLVDIACKAIERAQLKPVSAYQHRIQDL